LLFENGTQHAASFTTVLSPEGSFGTGLRRGEREIW